MTVWGNVDANKYKKMALLGGIYNFIPLKQLHFADGRYSLVAPAQIGCKQLLTISVVSFCLAFLFPQLDPHTDTDQRMSVRTNKLSFSALPEPYKVTLKQWVYR